MTEGGLSSGRNLGKLTSIVGCFGRKLKLRRTVQILRVRNDKTHSEHNAPLSEG